jgi:putative ABC transport system ATP-binding protein
MLNMVGCLDVPSKGKIFLDGRDITKMSENELAQVRGRKIGFVFQQFNLLHNLSALENVMLPMIFQGRQEKSRQKRAELLLTTLGLEDRMKHRPAELSGGEQQRIAIARALANDPEIIVADEPTGNLDSVTGKKIMEILTNLHRDEHKTVVVVTHDPTIAEYSNQVVHIKDGRIVSNHFAQAKVLWQK